MPRDDIATCIDLIFTSDRYAFIDSGVIPSEDPFCKHQIITGKVDFNIPAPPKTKRKVWEYDKSNFRGLRNDLTSTNWDLCFEGLHPNEMASILTTKLLEFADSNIPSKDIIINDRESPWVTPAVRMAINRNKRVYKKWIQRGRISADKH